MWKWIACVSATTNIVRYKRCCVNIMRACLSLNLRSVGPELHQIIII
tara:strand:+ start:277 stop:417 length:141 start_codon:yes stop_codon:yes gene_type:complete